ncbi:MAG: hypothetical protein Kow0099_37910 [Candidatus Abyssubacteria bacterium]
MLVALGIIFFLAITFHKIESVGSEAVIILGNVDTYFECEPWLTFIKRTVQSGAIPLWNPHQAAGHPFLAQGYGGISYPLTWLALILDVSTAMLVIEFFNIIIAMVGMVLYTRYLKVNWPAVTVAAAFFGYLEVNESFNQGYGCPYCWLPLIFWLAHRIYDKPSFKMSAAFAIPLSLSFLGGFSQYTYYTGVLVAVYFLFLLLFDPAPFGERRIFRRLSLFGLSFLLSAGLLSFQLLPTAELARFSVRSLANRFTLAGGINSYEIYELLRSQGIFFGGFCLFVPFSFAASRNRTAAIALFATLSYCILFVLSKYLYHLSFFGMLPFADAFRFPQRILRMGPFLVSVLAAIGISSLWEVGRVRFWDTEGRRVQWFWVFTVPYMALVLHPVWLEAIRLVRSSTAYLILLLPFLSLVISFAVYTSNYSVRNKTMGIIGVGVFTAGGLAAHKDVLSPLELYPFMVALLTVLLVMVLSQARNLSPRSRSGVTWGVAGLLLVDILTVKFSMTMPFTAAYKGKDPLIDWAVEHAGYDRVLIHNEPNFALASARNFYTMADYEPFTLERFKNYVRAWVGAEKFDSSNTYFYRFYGDIDNYFEELLENPHMMGLASLRYVVTEQPLIGREYEGWRLCHESTVANDNDDDAASTFYVYENEFSVPRTYLVSDYVGTHSEQESLEAIEKHRESLRNSVVLEGGLPSFPPSRGAEFCGKASITEYGINEVRIKVEALRPSLLVLTDSYFPGWKVYLDDIERPIWRANSLFRAVEVPPGDHTVNFEYRPTSVRWGLSISLATLVLALAGLTIEERQSARVHAREAPKK